MTPSEVTVLVWDDPENFNKEKLNWGFYSTDEGEKCFYKNVFQIYSKKAFEKLIKNHINEDDNLIFCCHIKYETLSGYQTFVNNDLTEKFRIPRVIYVSSGGKEATKKLDKAGIKENVLVYADVINKLKSGNIEPFKKTEILRDSNKAKKDITKQGIFLSHASNNKEIVEKFKDLILINGLNIHAERIKFTSTENMGIPGGKNISKDLRDFIKDEMGLFIQFITEDYTTNRNCLNEEGAAWVLLPDIMRIPILVNTESNQIAWFNNLDKGIKANDFKALKNIYYHRSDFFDTDTKTDANTLDDKLNEFVDYVNKEIYKDK